MLPLIQVRPLGLALLAIVTMASAQTQGDRETLFVQGYRGEANVIRSQGHILVDVQDLARITKGSLSFEDERISLALGPSDASISATDIAAKLGLSEGTIRNYLSEAINKLGAQNRVEAARIARAKGWL